MWRVLERFAFDFCALKSVAVWPSNMSNPVLRVVIAILTALLMASAPVQAEPVRISEVMQILGNLQNSPELRLRRAWKQDAGTSSVIGTQQSSASGKRLDARSIEIPTTSNSTVTNSLPSSLFAGLEIIPDFQKPSIEQIGSGSVQGTVCDCGEIMIAGGAFPKWSLLFLTAVPLFFLHPGDHTETLALAFTSAPLTATAPSPSPSVPVPEPTTLFLLATGLTAFGVRLRRRKIKNLVTKNQTK